LHLILVLSAACGSLGLDNDPLQPNAVGPISSDATPSPGVPCKPCKFEPDYAPPTPEEKKAAEKAILHVKPDLVDGSLPAPDASTVALPNTFEPQLVDPEARNGVVAGKINENVEVSRDEVTQKFPVVPEMPKVEEEVPEAVAETSDVDNAAADASDVVATNDENEGHPTDMSDATDGPVVANARLNGLDGDDVIDHAESIDPQVPGTTEEPVPEEDAPENADAAPAVAENNAEASAAAAVVNNAVPQSDIVQENNPQRLETQVAAPPSLFEAKSVAARKSPFGNLKAKLLRGQ